MTFGILALGFPVSEVLEVLQPLGAHSLTFFPILPYLNAWRLASWPWGSLFRKFWRVLQPLGAHSLTFFPILPYLNAFLGDVWHPGPGVPCFGGFGGFAAFGGSQSHFLPYSSLFFPILMYSLGDVWHPGPGVPCFGGFAGFAAFGGSPLGAHSLTFFPILPYLNAFLRWRLASWPWGSLFRRFCRFCSLWGLTVSLSSLFFPILMHSLGDVWHPGPGVPCFGGFGGFCSLWGLTVSLSSLFFPILMHSLGDVWHPGPGVPCFGGFGGFAAFGGSQSHFLPYSSLS